jgi:selenide,water dikinase
MKHLVLLGGGHAHVHVLKSLAEQPLADTAVTLISPFPRQVYSGMLPGWIAGHYDIAQCVLSLMPLAAAAGAKYLQTQASGIDLAAHEVVCDNGERVRYDVLSLDVGSAANHAAIPGAAEHALAIRPIEKFITAITQLRAELASPRNTPLRIAVAGAGAGGVEIALALQHYGAMAPSALHASPACSISMISAANTLPGSVGPLIAKAIRHANITLYAGTPATEISTNAVTLADGRKIVADKIIVALGAAAPAWLAGTGLQCDAQGYLLINDNLQSTSHANVFAAGDCATMQQHTRPKSGVYAVRAGPPLAANLRAAITGAPLTTYQPQARSLYLISTGRKHAIASWGPLSWEADWVWRWKDRIDRAFIAKYRPGATE